MSGPNESSTESEHVVPHRWWSEPTVRQILDDLAGFVEIAERLHARGETIFMSDEALPLAAEAVINRIGEAVNRLPDAFKADFPAVPWRAIRGMRNLLSHHYESANSVMIWQTLETALPTFGKALGLDRLRHQPD